MVVLNAEDNTPLKVYQKYLEKADFWRELTEYNLLADGVEVRVPKHMLKIGQIPAKVNKFSGRVQIARHFDWKWVPVVPNILVSEGDWIRTRSRSSVEIRQDDGTVIELRPNSQAMFSLAGTTKTARGEVRVTQIKLDSGSVIAKVNKLLQRDSRFEIETPTPTSFVRGTEFRVKVETQGGTRLEVLEGAVDFGSSDDNISVAGNFGSLVEEAGNTPVSPHALPMAPSQLFTPAEREVLEGRHRQLSFQLVRSRRRRALPFGDLFGCRVQAAHGRDVGQRNRCRAHEPERRFARAWYLLLAGGRRRHRWLRECLVKRSVLRLPLEVPVEVSFVHSKDPHLTRGEGLFFRGRTKPLDGINRIDRMRLD